MSSDSIKIRFYFPDMLQRTKSKRNLAWLIMKEMRKDGGVNYAGYLKEKDLQGLLRLHIDSNNSTHYKPLSAKQKLVIKKIIREIGKKCHKSLPHPDLPIFVFVYPWFPNDDDRTLFEGIMAFAIHHTIHLFIDCGTYTQTSLRETIAHEWNHLVFYQYHPEQDYSLRTHIIMEGFAEVFREEAVGGKPAPWALALTRKEAREQLALLQQHLNTKGMKIYREVFYGDKKYKRWTGYSIGYRLIKEFRKKYPKLSWKKIIKTKPEDIL
jgi:uncharacterized protein YjaZ